MPRMHLYLSGISFYGFPVGEIDLLLCVKVTILQKPEGRAYFMAIFSTTADPVVIVRAPARVVMPTTASWGQS
jgi:hypothetical protein